MDFQWHVARDGKVYGPYSPQQLREMASTGKISPGDLVWRDGMAEWADCATIPGFIPTTHTAPSSDASVRKVICAAAFGLMGSFCGLGILEVLFEFGLDLRGDATQTMVFTLLGAIGSLVGYSFASSFEPSPIPSRSPPPLPQR